MFACFIKYIIDPGKIKESEEYAQAWIKLVQKYGGIHHGYFLPGNDADEFPKTDFSFPSMAKEGEMNIAVALFSFSDVETYEAYRKNVAEDKDCKVITERLKASRCFLRYERSFLRPIF
ncbi:TPA: NIPSNAP family protein [Candidatus Dependentiae bacterium]|nr:MAG: NIPSNAP family containing protein [candidate division TM6 bacterium GW2011_GWF2_36_131]KKQ03626.1 MAG: NIPSNAP family containing protein [candidate division TM6 bacterium GW2011_GWE2_36_25]KKQ18070.1 MAG: NIPSNAP family containing protein [candidate division TM6 bacterium GW2011_GWA2_36_9]HBR70642.1 NIPSNAP family protein [Candidatus Dependentiae bacterium]HCU00262.1 NIPSNAP family protein [Candidatus Dependentiae bacterium]